MEHLKLIVLLVSTLYIVIGLTNSKFFTYPLEYPMMDLFGVRKITRVADKILLYLSILLQSYYWLYL